MDFRLLGPLEVVEHGRVLELSAAKQRALLAILLLDANEVVSTARLIEGLWPEEAPRTAAKSIQVYVSGLRKELGDGRLETRSPGYALRVEPGELDAARFEDLLAEAQGATADRAAGLLREALALWRGPALADLAGERFARPAIARLEDLRLAALERRIDADLEAGRHADVVADLEALVADDRSASLTDSEGARFRLLEAATAMLRSATRDRTFLLFLDDLHAADEASLLLLRFVARSLGDARILVVGAYRDDARYRPHAAEHDHGEDEDREVGLDLVGVDGVLVRREEHARHPPKAAPMP